MPDLDNDYTEFEEGADGQFYWHRRAGNNQNLAVGGEGFHDRDAAVTSYNRARDSMVHDAGIGVPPMAAPAPIYVTERASIPWPVLFAFILLGIGLGVLLAQLLDSDSTPSVKRTTTVHRVTSTSAPSAPGAEPSASTAAPLAPAPSSPASSGSVVGTGSDRGPVAPGSVDPASSSAATPPLPHTQ
jgi:hypothetical protein